MPFDVTDAGLDVWRPAVAREGATGVVVVWSEFRDGNWDLYARHLNTASGAWSGKPQRLTNDPGADTDAVLATGAEGVVWMAWQAWRNGQADILLAPVDDLSRTVNVSDHPADDWSPSLAIGPQGRRSVAFDSYRNGSYDVLLYRGGDGNKRLTTVAGSTRFEVRPSLAIDAQGRTWVAYEERGDNWGKDFGVHADKPGVPLYQTSSVRVVCVDGDERLRHRRPGGPGHHARGRARRSERLVPPPGARPRRPALARSIAAASRPTSRLPSCSRGWVPPGWNTQPRGSVGPGLLPSRCPGAIISSTTAPRSSRSPAGRGRSWRSTPSDGRLHREGTGQASAPNDSALKGAFARKEAAAAAVVRRTNNDIFVAALTAPAGAAEPTTGAPAVATAAAPPAHPNEAEDVARIRAHRVSAGGKTYQLLRGEFHRHTDISPDGGGDGTLEDMWRYALDVAALDWIGCGDHDNGNGREYTWWLTQKTTDLYHAAPRFNPMFTYERSVAYPGGHRNVMFAQRGVRTLPRLSGDDGVKIDERRPRPRRPDALQVPARAGRHLRGAHLGHHHGDRLAGERSQGRAVRRDLPGRPRLVRVVRRAPRRPWPRRRRGGLAAPGDGLERAGAAVSPGLPGLERPHLDPHQLRRRHRRSRHPRGDLRRLPAPPLLCGDRQHRPRRPLRRPPDGRRVHHPGARPRSGSWRTAPGRSSGSRSSRISTTSTRPSPARRGSSSPGPTRTA